MAQSHVSIAAAEKRRRRSARRLMRRVRRARPVSCLILTLIAVIMLIPIVFTFFILLFSPRVRYRPIWPSAAAMTRAGGWTSSFRPLRSA